MGEFSPIFMKRNEITHQEITKEALEREKKKSKSMQRVLRCLGLQLILEGEDRQTIRKMLKVGQNTIGQWITRVNKKGIVGLDVEEGRGRKIRVGEKAKQDIQKALLKNPRTFGYKQSNWTGKLIRKRLEEKYGVVYKRSSIYPLLKALGFTLQRPQRLYGEADIDAQNGFKKNSKIFSRRIQKE